MRRQRLKTYQSLTKGVPARARNDLMMLLDFARSVTRRTDVPAPERRTSTIVRSIVNPGALDTISLAVGGTKPKKSSAGFGGVHPV